MIKEQFKKNPILWIFILVCIVGYSYFQWLKTLPQNYTAGTIEHIYKPLKGGTRADFRYKVSGSEYVQSVGISGYQEVTKVGKRFLVHYPEDHVGEGFMLLDHPIPEGVEAPPEGWDEKPLFKQK